MNREILFRGKRLDNGEWETGSLVIVRMGCHDEQCFIADKMTGYHTPIDPVTVGQYTGLQDESGKQIFEGDVIEYNNGFDYFKGEVVFENGSFGIGSYELIGISEGSSDNFVNLWQLFWDQEFTDEPELYYCTVIGNIHDNPELLEGGEG